MSGKSAIADADNPALSLLDKHDIANLKDAIINQNRISAQRLELEKRQNADTKALNVSVKGLTEGIAELLKGAAMLDASVQRLARILEKPNHDDTGGGRSATTAHKTTRKG